MIYKTVDQIVDKIMTYETGTKVVRGRKSDSAANCGYVRARVDGIIYDLSENIPIEKNKKHNIEIIVDRLVIKPEIASRLSDSIETASKLGAVVRELHGCDFFTKTTGAWMPTSCSGLTCITVSLTVLTSALSLNDYRDLLFHHRHTTTWR